MLSNLEKWLDEFGLSYEVSGDDWYLFLCPFHEDSNPSAFINRESHIFHCKTCGAKGDVYYLLAQVTGSTRDAVIALVSGKKPLPQDRVFKQHGALMKQAKVLAIIHEDKGLTDETVIKYQLGWNKDRVSIPIFDKDRVLVNIRRWKPRAKKFKVINERGFGGRRLYPIEAMEEDVVLVIEGETKALLLRQMGFNAISPTGGAGTWAKEWNQLFRGKTVYVVYDIDSAGRAGAQRIASALNGIAAALYNVALPLNLKEFPHGDVTDWVVGLGATSEDVADLLEQTPAWKPIDVYDLDIEDEEDPVKVSLAQASNARYFFKSVSCEVVVSAKDVAPYIVPREVDVTCLKDKDWCGICPVSASDLKSRVRISNRHPALLEMIDTPVDQLRRVLKKWARIPRACEEFTVEVVTTCNVEEVRLIPQLYIGDTDDTHVVRRAFYTGDSLDANTTYEVTAKVFPEPKTQYATLLIYEAEPSVDSLSQFKLTQPKPLEVFQPTRWTFEGVDEKLKELYDDLSANVTRIYQRHDLHLVVDLAYHSVLYVPFQGQTIKGWIEALILGDSGQGKSECSSKLREFYGLGEKVDAKGASVAGLIGGLQETARRWFVSWGVITLQDRRLVILEEVKGLPLEVIAKLTEVRSSGVAEVAKVEKARTNARTRLIWISNPRSDRKLLSYNFGVEAVRELIGTLEDVRRFDVAIIVASGDVPRRVINLPDEDRPVTPALHTRELCRQLILWGWSRTVGQVELERRAVQAALDLAGDLGEKYVSNIPLIEAADQRLKLARLATSLAVRTFSHHEGSVIVRPCHVEYAADALDRLYSADTFGYEDYSRMIKTEQELRDPEEVEERVSTLSYAKDTVRAMLDATTLSAFDIADWTENDLESARAITGFLVRKNALKRARRGYMKTTAFISMLKRLDKEGLTNEGEEDTDEV